MVFIVDNLRICLNSLINLAISEPAVIHRSSVLVFTVSTTAPPSPLIIFFIC